MATPKSKPAKAREGSFRPKSRAEWRRWLHQNHATKTSVLLVCAKKGTGLPTVTYEESVEEALCYGWIDGVRHAVDERFFTQRFTPRKPASIWSKLNLERIARLKKAGLMHPSGLAAFAVGKRAGRHDTAYAVSDQVKVPAELTAALARNARGRAAFEKLTPGQKKAWMRSISWTKSAATRASRAEDALLLVLAGRKAGETDAQAARRGVKSKAEILGERAGRRRP
jgi:uncharacterized protein YdeI (YjbR/CyaY-like superfamily)